MTAQTKIVMPLVSDDTFSHWLGLQGLGLLESVLSHADTLRIAVTSSFGSESAVLLDLVAQVNKATPVIFVDTGRLFAATTDYRDQLADHLGLSNVQTLKAPALLVENTDPQGTLFETDPDACCHVRKVMPYAQALSEFEVLIGGRKRHHGDKRSDLKTVELSGPHIKVNPLAHFTPTDIQSAFKNRNLPPHPLVQEGYSSLGCEPCTLKSCAAGNVRAGRWKGRKKTECGIHFTDNRVYDSLTDSGL